MHTVSLFRPAPPTPRRLTPLRRSLCLVWLFAAISCNGSGAGQEPSPVRGRGGAAPVVRDILAQMEDAPGAPGRRLTLVRYTIAPGAELAPHVHPGVQLASIVSGTLSYRIVSGTAIVQRGVGADGIPARTERLTGPADTTLAPGDAIVEEGDMVHFGANRTNRPVSILATLITEGADLAVPVDLP